ncbi:hypothetical protein ABTH88_22760, partial [Acinetobacter baumannii]
EGVAIDDPRLFDCADALGSDVPACLYSRTAIGRGRGERLARVDSHFEQILGSKLLTLLKTNVSREDPGDAQVVFARLDA